MHVLFHAYLPTYTSHNIFELFKFYAAFTIMLYTSPSSKILTNAKSVIRQIWVKLIMMWEKCCYRNL